MKKLCIFFICFNKILAAQIFSPQEREEIAVMDVLSYSKKEEEFLSWREDETGQERREERLRQQEQTNSEESIFPP